MLKATAASIAPSLTVLFNLSISSCSVPNSWKLSTVVPIPKTKHPSNNPGDYRPISLLSIISKLLERHVHGLRFGHLHQNGASQDPP